MINILHIILENSKSFVRKKHKRDKSAMGKNCDLKYCKVAFVDLLEKQRPENGKGSSHWTN